MIGSTSKTVTLGRSMGAAVSGGKESDTCDMISLYRVSRTCSSA